MGFIKRFSLLLILLDLLIISLIVFQPVKRSPQKDANSIFNACSNLLFREQCYADDFYNLTKKTDLEYAVSVLDSLQEIDPKNAIGCHFIAHRISVAEVEKNPDKWQDVFKRIKVASCTGGFVHGVIEGHYEKDPNFPVNSKTVDLICNKILNDKSFGVTSCDHIMGHILMIENAGLVDRSVNECNKLGSDIAYQCLSGVFMEEIIREGLVSHGLAEPLAWTPENTLKIEDLCNQQTGLAQKACWQEISYMYAAIDSYVPKDMFNSCNRAPTEEASTACYIYGIGNAINFTGFEDKNLTSACSVYSPTDGRYILCTFQIMGSLIASSERNIGKMINMCQSIGDEFKPSCYTFLLDVLKKDKVSNATLTKACSTTPLIYKAGKC